MTLRRDTDNRLEDRFYALTRRGRALKVCCRANRTRQRLSLKESVKSAVECRERGKYPPVPWSRLLEFLHAGPLW
jgi:hypothetical protein